MEILRKQNTTPSPLDEMTRNTLPPGGGKGTLAPSAQRRAIESFWGVQGAFFKKPPCVIEPPARVAEGEGKGWNWGEADYDPPPRGVPRTKSAETRTDKALQKA